ncbi:MAG TPA: helix-turn-helix transcriptional regulator [Rhizomicrobium sp.]|nr:helix-turn-helix transcriptional regulator [Rhizomicrobium sp.]
MDQNRNELGDFLRSRRERLRPKPHGAKERRRRTPGLRREEVAELAGIGVDWYIRLEQGRSVSPSVATVDALARALRLSKAEHAHFRALTQKSRMPAFVRETVPDTLLRVVGQLNQPAYITGRRWDVLAWNDAADKIFAFSRLAESDRNILLNALTNPRVRRMFGASWEDEARRMIAQFRATYDLWAGDPAFNDLLRRLREGSPEFAKWWAAHDIRGVKSGKKTLSHPKAGVLRFEYATFQSNDDPALKLAIYAPLPKS